MRTLLILGPPGAGKTTFIRETLNHNVLPGTVAVVCNDDGTRATTDATALVGSADIVTLNSGCFGCRDEESARRVFRHIAASGRYEWLIVEPYGFIAGDEAPSVLRSVGLDPLVITLVDVRHFAANRELGAIVPSQLRAATLGVGFTKFPSSVAAITDAAIEEMVEYVAHHAQGIPLFLIPSGHGLPSELLLERPVAKELQCRIAHCAHHHHDPHPSSSREDHNHGVFTYNYVLSDTVTLTDLQDACCALDETPWRVKGVIAGRQFHALRGEWTEGMPHATRNFITIYHPRALDMGVFAPLVASAERTESAPVALSTKDLLRSAADLTPEQCNRIVERLIAEVPVEPITTAETLLTNPELHEILNEVRKRPGVDPELNAAAIRRRVMYYLSVAPLLMPGSPYADKPETPRWKRDIAIGIGWFASAKATELGPEIVTEALRVDLEGFLADGLLGISEHNSNLTRALEFVDEVGEVLKVLRRHYPFGTRLRQALRHASQRARHDGREELVKAWRGLMVAWRM